MRLDHQAIPLRYFVPNQRDADRGEHGAVRPRLAEFSPSAWPIAAEMLPLSEGAASESTLATARA
jgi:hypothetical protein